MKNLFHFTIMCIILLSGCNEAEKLLTFNINNTTEIIIPAQVNIISQLKIPTPDVKTNSEQEFSNNNTQKDLVKDVKLTSLSLNLKEPSGKTFSFLKSISIYISADGVAEKKLAYLDNIPENVGAIINLTSTKEKLDDFIKKDKYNIRTEVVTDEAFAQDIKIDAKMTFRVTADIL